MDPVKSSKQNVGDSTGPPRYRNDKHFTLHRNVPVAILFKFKIQLVSGIFAGVVIIMTRGESSASSKSAGA